jgi:hypothetical protein
MAAQTKLTELEERKQLLVLQAELHRAVLQAEVVNARACLGWVARAREILPGGPWWLAGGTAAGLLLARKWRPALKLVPAGLAAWRWFRKLKRG